MADSTINLEVFSNADLYRDFQLKEGATVEAATPTDITGMTLASEVRDEDGELVLRMDSDDATTLVITDAVLGKFGFRIDRALLPTDRKQLKYDVLLTDGAFTRRLWGGSIKVKLGTTADT